MSRIALIFAGISVAFFFNSWPPSFYPDDFRNRIAVGIDIPHVGAGFGSNRRVASTFFYLNSEYRPYPDYRIFWSERRDGHCCVWGGNVTPSKQSSWGLSFQCNSRLIGWDLPYWFTFVLWSGVFLKASGGLRLGVLDFLLFTTAIAVSTAASTLGVGVLLALPMSIATVGLLLLILIGAVRAFIRSSNPWWPITIAVRDEGFDELTAVPLVDAESR